MVLLMAAARGVVAAASDVQAGGWAVPQGGIHGLQGRRLALLGVGRTGYQLAQRGLAFGLEVVAHDPFLAEWPAGLGRVESFEEAVAEEDFVSLRAPVTSGTHHLIDDRSIGLIRRGPIIVNTARGGLVDLDAVTRALEDGRLAGVALDVAEVDPLPADHPLRSHPRAVITPHNPAVLERA